MDAFEADFRDAENEKDVVKFQQRYVKRHGNDAARRTLNRRR